MGSKVVNVLPAVLAEHIAAVNAFDTNRIVATFAPDGPDMCSGLPVERYDAAGLGGQLGTQWELVAEDRHAHTTPAGTLQPFTWAAFQRTGTS